MLVALSAVLTRTASAQGDSAITSNDPRIGLHAGLENAGEAARNLVLIGHVDRPQNFGNPQNPADFGFLNADLAFMGAAFLLLETKNVVQFALLFGTTWLVNSITISGLLLRSCWQMFWSAPVCVFPGR